MHLCNMFFQDMIMGKILPKLLTGEILYLQMHSLNMPLQIGRISCCILTYFTFVIFYHLVYILNMPLQTAKNTCCIFTDDL